MRTLSITCIAATETATTCTCIGVPTRAVSSGWATVAICAGLVRHALQSHESDRMHAALHNNVLCNRPLLTTWTVVTPTVPIIQVSTRHAMNAITLTGQEEHSSSLHTRIVLLNMHTQAVHSTVMPRTLTLQVVEAVGDIHVHSL